MTTPFSQRIAGGGSKSTRPQRLVAVLGRSGAGKSSLCAQLVEDALRAGLDVRIVDPAGNWPGIGEWAQEGDDDPRSEEQIGDATFREIMKDRKRGDMNMRPMLLVLDDADQYLDGTKCRGAFKRLFTTYRHYRMDVLVTARRTQDLPKVIFTSASNVYLFQHFVSTDYIGREWGADVVDAIPQAPFQYVLFDVEKRTLTQGKTRRRVERTAADGA